MQDWRNRCLYFQTVRYWGIQKISIHVSEIMKVKELLSDFVNLIYPKPEGEAWKWGEIIFVLGIIGFTTQCLVFRKSKHWFFPQKF